MPLTCRLPCLKRRRRRATSESTETDSNATSSSIPGDASIDAWAERVLEDVQTSGLTIAFKRHVELLSREALVQPARLCAHLERWVQADPDALQALMEATPPRVDANWAAAPIQTERRPDAPVSAVVEGNGSNVPVFRDELFKNWAATVAHVPAYTFAPCTRVGVMNVVRFALREGLRVRVTGARHTWSELYGASGDVIISMIPVTTTATVATGTAMPNSSAASPLFPPRGETELQRVRLEAITQHADGRRVARVRVGAAATAHHLRTWALAEDGGNWRWMLSAWPALASATSAGCTQAMCHGTGLAHASVADLVVEVELVNCRGELQTIRDATQLRAVSGSFGLLGVVVSQVFLLDPMKLVNLLPLKKHVMLAVPPFCREDISPCVDIADREGLFSEDMLYQARLRFESDCRKFHSEWWWFPLQRDCWVNCWDVAKNTGAKPRFPDTQQVATQSMQAALARVFEISVLRLLPPQWHAELLGFAAMRALPGGELLRSNVPDALQLRRASHRMPVRCCQMEIEIPARLDGTPDFSVCQKAWWMAINAVYDALPSMPLRTAVEMRVVGSSDITLSPQRFNEFGTCAIDVLTNSLVDDREWLTFIDHLVDRWASLRNPLTGHLLRIRPHFASEWPSIIRSLPALDFLQGEYTLEIGQFKRLLASACADGGYTFRNSIEVFGNDVLLEFLGEIER